MYIYIYIHVYIYIYIYVHIYIYPIAKQVRTVPVRGLGTEKNDFGNCASPHPHPPPRFFRKLWQKHGKRIQNEIIRPPGDAPNAPFGDPKSMVAKNKIFDELWGAKGCQRCAKGTPNGLF